MSPQSALLAVPCANCGQKSRLAILVTSEDCDLGSFSACSLVCAEKVLRRFVAPDDEPTVVEKKP